MILDLLAKWFLIIMIIGINAAAAIFFFYCLFLILGVWAFVVPMFILLLVAAACRVNRPGSTV